MRDAKNLRFSKYGDRLEQFFGSKDAADNYVSELQRMDDLGAHAATKQWVAKWAGRIALYETAKHVIGQTGGKVANVISDLP